MRLRFVLPPSWVGFPLASPEACDLQVDRTVKALQLDDGEGARLRRELRDDLRRQVATARESGASYLSISGPRSAPLSGSILVTPVARSLPLDDPTWVERLTGDVDTFRLEVGRVIRVVTTRTAPSGSSDVPDHQTLGVDYWVQGPGGEQVQIACSTPLVAHRDAMVQLFDTVVDSAEWADTDEAAS